MTGCGGEEGVLEIIWQSLGVTSDVKRLGTTGAGHVPGVSVRPSRDLSSCGWHWPAFSSKWNWILVGAGMWKVMWKVMQICHAVWLFSSKGLIYVSLLEAALYALRKTPHSLLLLLERLPHNKFHKWQNSFLSLSFPLSSLLSSLPHPTHFQRRKARGGGGVE